MTDAAYARTDCNLARVKKFARIVCGLILEWSGTRLSSLLWPLLYYIERFSVLCSCSCCSWPCQNNGTCVSHYERNSYVCLCKKEFSGKHCQSGNRVFHFYYIHFEIIGYPCNVIGSQRCDLFPNRTIFCSKSHLFSRPMRMAQKNKTTNQISRLFLNLPITLQENERQKSLFSKFGNFCCENFIKFENGWI